MTEIHERLQPVAEVGENGSNGDEDSISGDQPVIPLGNLIIAYQVESRTLRLSTIMII